jgi:hypothetical protein
MFEAVCIGGAAVDRKYRVSRNVAEVLARLGMPAASSEAQPSRYEPACSVT